MNARRLTLATLISLCALAGGLLAAGPVLAAAPETPETRPATLITATTATLNGVLNPGASAKVGWYFAYATGLTCTGAATTPLEPEVEGEGLPEHVEVTGLEPAKNYRFCLIARNEAGESSVGSEVSFTTLPAAPQVSEESVTAIGSRSAILTAQINPEGADTRYRFEYGTGAEYKPVIHGEGDAGEGTAGVTVSVPMQEGLLPATAYHFRVVATNSVEAVDGEERTFTTQPAGGAFLLPDGRAWEMVSPPNKDGAEIENVHTREGGVLQASESGEAITYLASAPIEPNPPGSPIETQVLSRRASGGGWSSQDIATKAGEGLSIGEVTEYKAFTPDLSLALVQPTGAIPLAPPAPASGSYTRDNNTGAYTPTAQNQEEWYAQHVPPAAPTCDVSTSPAGGAGDGASEDGCYVYWRGAAGLEVSHYNGTNWTTTLIASGVDGANFGHSGGFGGHGSIHGALRVSPNGEYLTFMSQSSLTGYDNRDALSGAPDEEVYLYHAATNRLVCASCNPTGARPVGVPDGGAGLNLLVDRQKNWAGNWLAGILPAWTNINVSDESFRQPRSLSDSGRLFFNSPDALVPQDVNGQMDVYEYEPAGVGSCGKPAGCVALISAGTSSVESGFVDASANGNDVFFLTRSRLVGQDYDNYYDMYDAHACMTSAPCLVPPPVAPPPCDTGDSCKAAPSLQPAVFGAPPSATFVGAGNVVPAVSAPMLKAKSLTRSQRLLSALRACKRKQRAKRRACESQARRRYGTKSKAAGARSPHMTTKRNNQGA